MATRQRTFDLVPTSLARSNGQRPPMTSKAAKKAHQIATRGPRVSRVEQRRLEAEELAQQKREYEREKAEAKVKAGREKKAAKEQADRELRKKNGIPKPSRFVRASQPTISKFVKAGNKRTWLETDTHGEDSDATAVGDEEAGHATKAFDEAPAKKVKTRDDSGDEYGDFPLLSQSDLETILEDAESPAKLDTRQKRSVDAGTSGSILREPPPVTAGRGVFGEAMSQDPNSFDDMVTTQLLLEAADAEARKRRPSSVVEIGRQSSDQNRSQPLMSSQELLEAVGTAVEEVKRRGVIMLKILSPDSSQELLDAADASIRNAEQLRHSISRAQPLKSTQDLLDAADAVLKNSERQGLKIPETFSPKSTQELLDAADAVLKSANERKPRTFHLSTVKPKIASAKMANTRFPRTLQRPSVERRPALQERSINMPPPRLSLPIKEKRSISFATSPVKARTIPSLPAQRVVDAQCAPPSATQAFLENHLDDFFPSPSQEIRELLADVDDLPSNTQIARELGPEPDMKLPPNAPIGDNFADLISTQDLILSSQDMLDISTPCPPPSKPQRIEKPSFTPTPMPVKPRQPRRRFFEEKDEDLEHAAIEESKVLAAKQDQWREQRESYERANRSRAFSVPQAQDLPHAAIQERKALTETKEQWKEQKKYSGRAKQSRAFAIAKAPRNASREVAGKTRTFSRTDSNATDYGEDEFHDCEEELLALC